MAMKKAGKAVRTVTNLESLESFITVKCPTRDAAKVVEAIDDALGMDLCTACRPGPHNPSASGIPGILGSVRNITSVQRCDACGLFETDLEAQLYLSTLYTAPSGTGVERPETVPNVNQDMHRAGALIKHAQEELGRRKTPRRTGSPRPATCPTRGGAVNCERRGGAVPLPTAKGPTTCVPPSPAS